MFYDYCVLPVGRCLNGLSVVDSCQGNYFSPLYNRGLDAWRNNSGTKRGKMSLETLIFAYQRRFFKVFVLPLYLDWGNSIQDIRNKEALCSIL